LILASCDQVSLYQDLTEKDVNEILVLLGENGINATKEKEVRQNEISWSITVSKKDMQLARALLMKNNLPRSRELGLTGVYSEKGLIPTPDEQKARYILALKGEIINSLEMIPSVVEADVVLNVPTRADFDTVEEKMAKRPTASVIIKLRPSENKGEDPITEAKIQQFIANSVEGLNQRDVAVVISYLSTTEKRPIRPGDVAIISPQTRNNEQVVGSTGDMSEELVGLKLDTKSKQRLKIYLLVFFILLIVLSVGLIISIVQANRMRRKLGELEQGRVEKYPAIEGKIMDEGPPQLEDGREEE